MRHARRETDGRAFHDRQDADGDSGFPLPVFFKKVKILVTFPKKLLSL